MDLWEKLPKGYNEMTTIDYFPAEVKSSDCAFVIFPGGGYTYLAKHEGEGYAKMINCWGIDAFVVKYSVAPTKFPAQLNDARRAIQFVRYNAEKYGINPDKIIAMGSSAGGHLTSMLSTFKEDVETEANDDISKVNFLPDMQVLCYPVVDLSDDAVTHLGSKYSLLGENADKVMFEKLSPQLACDENTPPAFLWHNADDKCVNVYNSMNYVKKLISYGVPAELHIFPFGGHGVGVRPKMHCCQWTELLFNWLKEMKFY